MRMFQAWNMNNLVRMIIILNIYWSWTITNYTSPQAVDKRANYPNIITNSHKRWQVKLYMLWSTLDMMILKIEEFPLDQIFLYSVPDIKKPLLEVRWMLVWRGQMWDVRTSMVISNLTLDTLLDCRLLILGSSIWISQELFQYLLFRKAEPSC